MDQEQVTANVFVCPASNQTPSTAPTTQAQADDLEKPRYCSYIYLGKGLIDKTTPANAVVAYEPLANHGEGMHVLFGDGHVDFVNKPRANLIIAAATTASTQPMILPP